MRTPSHLSAAAKRFFLEVSRAYELEPHHDLVLLAACEAWTRMEQARRAVDAEGPFTTNRYGQLVAHPGIAVERDCRLTFARLVRQLGLDDEPETTATSRARHAAESRWSHSPRRAS